MRKIRASDISTRDVMIYFYNNSVLRKILEPDMEAVADGFYVVLRRKSDARSQNQ